MKDKNNIISSNIRIPGIDHQIKFDFFLLGLSFAMLGLAIQTADFNRILILNLIEWIGWILLFISCFLGLNRLSCLPNIFRKLEELKQLESKPLIKMAKPVEEIKDAEELKTATKELINFINNLSNILAPFSIYWGGRYKIQKYTFYSAFILLACSRASSPIIDYLTQ